MEKPDFDALAHELWPQITVPQSISKSAAVIEKALRAAFDAGLEHAAMKCELTMVGVDTRMGWVSEEMTPEYFEETQARHSGQAYASVIRAEKSK